MDDCVRCGESLGRANPVSASSRWFSFHDEIDRCHVLKGDLCIMDVSLRADKGLSATLVLLFPYISDEKDARCNKQQVAEETAVERSSGLIAGRWLASPGSWRWRKKRAPLHHQPPSAAQHPPSGRLRRAPKRSTSSSTHATFRVLCVRVLFIRFLVLFLRVGVRADF